MHHLAVLLRSIESWPSAGIHRPNNVQHSQFFLSVSPHALKIPK